MRKNNVLFICFIVFGNILLSSAYDEYRLRRLLKKIIERRRSPYPENRLPRLPEELPQAEPAMPGHSLIRPSRNMLKSSVKFPLKDLGALVYGNLDNLGITYGKTPYRVLYSGFRRSAGSHSLKLALIQAVRNIITSASKHGGKPEVVVFEINAPNHHRKQSTINVQNARSDKNDYILKEVIDTSSSEEPGESEERGNDYRKSNRKKKKKTLNSSHESNSSEEESSSTESSSDNESDFDRNPGNPYTLHRGKYKQNWAWNHAMTGDHMNISPLAPAFNYIGPSTDLFYGRKWWYFNQDDFRPLN